MYWLSVHVCIGVNASRNRESGAKAHLIGILSEGEPLERYLREIDF